MVSASRGDGWEALGERGIVFVDVSGYTQLVYHCVDDDERMERLVAAMQRMFSAVDGFEHVHIDGYAGDGFLALVEGPTPVKTAYLFAKHLENLFQAEVKGLMKQVGVRVHVALRVGLHVGKVWRYRVRGDETALISDAINAAARIVSSQVCRRYGIALSRACYRRLLLVGKQSIRDPDEVIQDRNRYPEPLEIYRLRTEEEEMVAQVRS
jgi:class 3 adenylate cyclase